MIKDAYAKFMKLTKVKEREAFMKNLGQDNQHDFEYDYRELTFREKGFMWICFYVGIENPLAKEITLMTDFVNNGCQWDDKWNSEKP